MNHLDFWDVKALPETTKLRLHWEGDESPAKSVQAIDILTSDEFRIGQFNDMAYCVLESEWLEEQALLESLK